jgi:inosose dehydratase
MSIPAGRIAGAPISWGVCEVPGWGHQLAPDRVLAEMRGLGLAATEFGPAGFLPPEPAAAAALLARHGLAAVGGFVPVVLHEEATDPLPAVRAALRGFVTAGAGTLVLAADTGTAGYDSRTILDEAGWRTLLDNLRRIVEVAGEAGIVATLHPHVGTLVERRPEVTRLLDGSDIPLCLDTGHLLVGGVDPVEIATAAPRRVAHVHLEDVDAGVAERVRRGEITYAAAVREGMYQPLGKGDVDIAGIVRALDGAGYTGWYVLEQDTVLTREPDGEGPVGDVRTSLDYLTGVAA